MYTVMRHVSQFHKIRIQIEDVPAFMEALDLKHWCAAGHEDEAYLSLVMNVQSKPIIGGKRHSFLEIRESLAKRLSRTLSVVKERWGPEGRREGFIRTKTMAEALMERKTIDVYLHRGVFMERCTLEGITDGSNKYNPILALQDMQADSLKAGAQSRLSLDHAGVPDLMRPQEAGRLAVLQLQTGTRLCACLLEQENTRQSSRSALTRMYDPQMLTILGQFFVPFEDSLCFWQALLKLSPLARPPNLRMPDDTSKNPLWCQASASDLHPSPDSSAYASADEEDTEGSTVWHSDDEDRRLQAGCSNGRSWLEGESKMLSNDAFSDAGVDTGLSKVVGFSEATCARSGVTLQNLVVLSQMAEVFPDTLPLGFSRYISLSSVWQVDFVALLNIKCLAYHLWPVSASTNDQYYLSFYQTMAMPMVICILAAIAIRFQSHNRAAFYGATLFLLMFIHPTVSLRALQHFDCRRWWYDDVTEQSLRCHPSDMDSQVVNGDMIMEIEDGHEWGSHIMAIHELDGEEDVQFSL
eukprot:gene27321-33656_t